MQVAIKLIHAFANLARCYAEDSLELGFLADTGFHFGVVGAIIFPRIAKYQLIHKKGIKKEKEKKNHV